MADASTVSGTSVTAKPLSEEAKIINDEFNALLSRDVLVRRGRNNRVFYKFIAREIFHDDQSSDELDLSKTGKSLLRKRKKHYYDSPLDYYLKEIPGFSHLFDSHLLFDKKFLQKSMRKLKTFYSKDLVQEIINKS